jgi:hypothetical protein
MSDEEFVRQHWERRLSCIEIVKGHWIINGFTEIYKGQVSDFPKSPEANWAAAAEFTRDKLEQIRQVEEEILWIRWSRATVAQEDDFDIKERIMRRLQDALTELKRGMCAMNEKELTPKASLTEQAVKQGFPAPSVCERAIQSVAAKLSNPSLIGTPEQRAHAVAIVEAISRIDLEQQLADQMAANEKMVQEKDALSVELAYTKTKLDAALDHIRCEESISVGLATEEGTPK